MVKTIQYILLLLFSLGISAVAAQSTNKNLRKKISSQSISYSTLLDSAQFYLQKDADKSIRFVEESLRVLNTKKRRDKSGVSESYLLLGDVYFYWKAYDLAISNYKIALGNIPSSKRYTVKMQLAKSYFFNKNYTASKTIVLELQQAKKLSSAQQINLWELMGDNSKGLQSLDSSLENYLKGLEIAKKSNFPNKVITLNSKIAEIYSERGDLQNAELNFQNSINIAEQQSVQQQVVQNEKLADFYRGSNQLDKEISIRKNSLEQIKNIPNNTIDTLNTQSLNYDIADAYVEQKRYVEAIPFLNKSIEVASLSNDLETEKNAVQRLSEVYGKVGNYDKALNNYQKYVNLVDLIYAKKETEIEDASEFSKTLAFKQNRINILEKDRELSENQVNFIEKEQILIKESNRRQRLIIYVLIAGLLLLFVVLFLMYKSNKQKKIANNLLALKSLRTQMNPHFIFNALNSVNGFIAKNDERTANKYLTDFSTLMRAVLENAEKDFIPLSEEIALIKLYLKLEHARFKEKFDYTFELDKKINIDNFAIPPMLLQPYIENAVWHGLRYKKDKGKLAIKIQQKDKNTLTVSITDDGIGRKKSTQLKTKNQLKKTSKGMGNISSRIAILNEMYEGKVSVKINDLFENGEGTEVLMSLRL